MVISHDDSKVAHHMTGDNFMAFFAAVVKSVQTKQSLGS